jgi:hypothetical protein
MKRIAAVKFCGAYDDKSKTYYYFTNIDDLEVGDICVVDSAPGLGLVKIKSFIDKSDKANAWIAQKVDMAAHYENLKRQQRIDTLRSQLEARKKLFEEKYLWEKLAETDEKAAAFLAEIKELEE